MVSLAFYVCSFLLWTFPYRGKYYKTNRRNFFANFSFALLQSSRFNLHIVFRLLRQTLIIEMTSLIRKEKVACENCATQTTRNNIVQYKKSCFAGTLCCTHYPNFSTKSQNDLNYHIAKKHSALKPSRVTFKCKLCYQESPGV